MTRIARMRTGERRGREREDGREKQGRLPYHTSAASALGSERAPEGESPSLAVLPARQLKETASRQRDVESNWK